MSRILIIGSGRDGKFLGNLLRETKRIASDKLVIDVISVTKNSNCPYMDVVNCYDEIKSNFIPILYKIPILRGCIHQYDIRISLKSIIKNKQSDNIRYDICNIQYLSAEYIHIADYLREICSKVVLSPWGSDVLRANKNKLKKLRKLVEKSDLITAASGGRFKEDVGCLLHVDASKWYNATMGDIIIDHLIQSNNKNEEMIKESFGWGGRYVIVCGYNCSMAQNHIEIIQAMKKIRNQLPSNYLLVFPMTYNINTRYMNKVKSLLSESGLNYQILETFLSKEALLNFRIATDLFIHAQTTDANSGTIYEYLYLRKKIINASWLKYPHHEKYGLPYLTFSTFEELPQKIMQAIDNHECKVSSQLVNDIEQAAWKYQVLPWISLYTTK